LGKIVAVVHSPAYEHPVESRPMPQGAFIWERSVKAVMTIPQPTAFSALIHGHDGQCPCCRRPFADAG
jgi:hypothetical protein